MTTAPNPFDEDPDAPDAPSHLVLRNAAGRLSLWPVFAPVPAGWTRCFGPAPHAACRGYTEEEGHTAPR